MLLPPYAQSANNNNPVFLENGPNTDKPPAFLDAFWTNNLSANSSVPSNNIAKTEVGPGDGVATLAVVLVNRGRSESYRSHWLPKPSRRVSSHSQERIMELLSL